VPISDRGGIDYPIRSIDTAHQRQNVKYPGSQTGFGLT
jgi:hypothetical protein